MMVLSGSGQMDRANELLDSMKQEFASHDQSGSLAHAYKVVGIPVCKAILAYRTGDHSQVLSTLGDVRHQLSLMGASHAQRDVFYHMLVRSAEHMQRGVGQRTNTRSTKS